MTTPVVDDSRAHQELLCSVAQNMGLQVEEFVEGADPMMDSLASEGPSRVSLPLIKIEGDHKVLVADTCLDTSYC